MSQCKNSEPQICTHQNIKIYILDILGKTEGSGGEKDWKGENWEIPKAERRCKRCAGQVQGEGEILLLLYYYLPFMQSL